MGHINHSKAFLLNVVPSTCLLARGITQYIATYQAEHNSQTITFTDNPSHKRLVDMEEHREWIVDIIVPVAAANDGVKKQTADLVACTRKAGVLVMVVMNKMDLTTDGPSEIRRWIFCKVRSMIRNYSIVLLSIGF